ncbi:MAG TPA: hypothetical protein VJT72_18175 [Pseudonocardiaceae bacterium]|nr:hypothetical protein [Pseudonocardiaceae bacterium]
MSSTARDGVRAGTPVSSSEAASLVESAMLLRWRAPELALLLADRAVTAAQDDQMAVLRADHLAVFALNRLGRHGEAAHRLFPAILDAGTPAGLRHELHVELAHCAAALGEPAIALGAVRTVLAAGDDVTPVLRGTALVAVAEAASVLGWGDLFTPALDEADELYREDPSLDRDTALLLRATTRAADAARHRRCGATAEAEAQARAGRELLAGLADPEHDSGEVSARLMLEIVLTLLDRDEGDAATQEVRALLRRPVRAAAAGAVGRLRLALATRVHLAQGRYEPALTLLADAVEGAQRHGVDAVLAECLEGLSHVHEARGEFADALHCVRAARAADGRHCRNVEAARAVLREHWGSARRELADMVDQIAALLGNTGTGWAGSDPDTGLLNAEITAGGALHQRADTETAKVEIPKEETPEADTADPAVGDAGPESEEPTDLRSVEAFTGRTARQSEARHHRGAGAAVCVSDLLPASALSAGRSGRRRAEEPTEERSEETPAVETRRMGDGVSENAEESSPIWREFPASGPPPAPTPRTMEWESANESSTGEGETRQMGLGDLLAEALAAYQESRGVRADDTGVTGSRGDDGTATSAGTGRIAAFHRGPGTRWTSGLQLAPPIDRGEDDPSEALTNPLLRLPDLTAEPLWIPPERSRRSAAGD